MPVSYGYRDIVLGLREAGLVPGTPVLVIGPDAAPEELRGGMPAVLSALLVSSSALVTPAFTFQTMVYPPIGPEDNGIDYEDISSASSEAEFFRKDMPVSSSLGPFPGTVLYAPEGGRSVHPVLSFAGIRAERFLEPQDLNDPLAPIDTLAHAGGDAILIGSDHTKNAALYLAEKRAGRKQFLRWALTTGGVVECPGFPGCSKGFQAITERLQGVEQIVEIGHPEGHPLRIIRVPLRDLLHEATAWIRENPRAMLCDSPACPLCAAVRASLPGEVSK